MGGVPTPGTTREQNIQAWGPSLLLAVYTCAKVIAAVFHSPSLVPGFVRGLDHSLRLAYHDRPVDIDMVS